MARSTGFKIKPCEEKALAMANQRRIELASWSRPADRTAFTALGKAVRELQKALKPFTDTWHSSELSMLLAFMQMTQLNVTAQATCRDMLDGLYEPLRILNDAAIKGAGGRGAATDPLVDRWILIAADAWINNECGKPSNSVNGRFFRALNDFHARTPEALAVTERQLRSALKSRDDSDAKPTK